MYGPTRVRVSKPESTLGSLAEQVLGLAAAREVLVRGGAWIGRKRVFDGARTVHIGDEVVFSQPPSGDYGSIAVAAEWVLYEDADLIVLDKPPGVYVEATPWDVFTNLRVALEVWLAARDKAAPPLHLAHRLDRDTSGVLVFSKSPDVNPALQHSFASGLVEKTYLCRCTSVVGELPDLVATGHGRGARGQFRVYPLEQIGQALPAEGGVIKPMQTRLRLLEQNQDSALVQAEPITGRTHQIRLHMAFLGHPLLGDARYGGPPTWNEQALSHHLLHAARLVLPHPRSGEPLSITAKPVWWI